MFLGFFKSIRAQPLVPNKGKMLRELDLGMRENVGSYCSSENSLHPLEKHPFKDHTSSLIFFRASSAERVGTGDW